MYVSVCVCGGGGCMYVLLHVGEIRKWMQSVTESGILDALNKAWNVNCLVQSE